jgi:hypothetical protein
MGKAGEALTAGIGTLAAEAPDPSSEDGRTSPEANGDSSAASSRGRVGALLRNRDVWLIALAATPFVLSALALIIGVGGDYQPASDHALTEMQVRDVGSHPVLVGLYSRSDWNHPGPLLFYVLAPFYRLVGGSSIGMNLGALAINGGSVVGMALVARRRGGTPLLLCTLLGCALLMRTLGAEFLSDPWNTFVTTLPFGLLIFLTWAVLCGDAWALPVAAVVASFLAQVHVGFVLLALPLLALGAAGLVLQALRERTIKEDWRRWLRPGFVSALLLVLLWSPVAIETATKSPSNLGNTYRWFDNAQEGTHTLQDGWQVMAGQFSARPEWLTGKRPFAYMGESPYLQVPTPPVWLLLVVAAGIMLWRLGRREDRRLIVVLGSSLLIGIVAVARTIGTAYEYRLRWSWLPALVAFVLVTWTGWQLLVRRWRPQATRALASLAVGGLLVVTGVNSYAGLTAGVSHEADNEVMVSLTPQVLEAIGHPKGQVLVDDPYQIASWYQRGLVLQLERRGIDARVAPQRSRLFGDHRVVDADRPVEVHLVVMMNEAVSRLLQDPSVQMIARWRDPSQPAQERRVAELDADYAAGRLDITEYFLLMASLNDGRDPMSKAAGYDVAVFVSDTQSP